MRRRMMMAATGDRGSLLDRYPGAAIAYSLRGLTKGGQAVIRARRDSDGAELDFTPTGIADGSLVSWSGSGSAFVKTWYDQSVNGVNATSVSASFQPRIVNSGALVTRGGIPAIEFFSDGQRLESSHILSAGFGIFSVAEFTSTVKVAVGTSYLSNLPAENWAFGEIGTGQIAFRSAGNIDSGYPSTFSRHIGAFTGDGLGSVSAYYNGVISETKTGHSTNFSNPSVVGGLPGVAYRTMKGYLQELIIYNSDKSGKQAAITDDINGHYGLF